MRAANIGMEPGIVVYSIPNRKLEKFTDFGRWPVWLNDDCRLLFRGTSAEMGDTELGILDTRSGKSHEIFTAPQGSFTDGILISPDNRSIYYPLLTHDANLWMVSLR